MAENPQKMLTNPHIKAMRDQDKITTDLETRVKITS